MSQGKSFIFDPRVFILPPFLACPKCGQQSFGVLGIHADRYTRRCRECWHDQHYSLPALKKAVIYIDQFAISEMMKALNPETKAHQAGRVDPFWLELFKQLDSLSKSQLIVCPDSSAHSEESLLSPFNEALRRMYRLFSHSVSFKDPVTIQLIQINDHLKGWISGTTPRFAFDAESMVEGGQLHGWTDNIIVSADFEWRQEWIDGVRAIRDQYTAELNSIFARWQTETDKNFNYWFEMEAEAYGVNHLRQCITYYNRLEAIHMGKLPPEDIYPPPGVRIVMSVERTLQNVGMTPREAVDKGVEYLTSSSLKELPFLKISSMMWAALARQAAQGGRRKTPSAGMSNDIKTISTLLPYCDSMFIDNECRGLLSDEPLRSEVNNFGTTLFSSSDKQCFMDYLQSILDRTPPEHFDTVKAVYGELYDKPYTSLYIDKPE